ncbi:unnamed protein product [Rotaria socialis]|uniref:F-box domain-containing protein n=2 Tax=Rotaria socialis TaxID=392032 RepID=A0A821DVM5_9BILA|nr:unnamed protein product [Rotaria socialis]
MEINMEDSFIQLNDLPDEMLMMIFKKLSNVEVLDSLIDVNKRLAQIASDSTFTNYLPLIKSMSNGHIYPLDDSILDRFCLQILPEIHQKIKWLDLESTSMERVLLNTNYPNLAGLSLYNIHEETLTHLLTDEIRFTRDFKNQILSLIIDINTNEEEDVLENTIPIIFSYIFKAFTNLQHFKFGSSSSSCPRLSFYNTCPFLNSSNLLELHVNLETFNDCLYLCDGRFNQLHILDVNILRIQPSNLILNNTESLPVLKCFSLSCRNHTFEYDELILPLLHRMLNLEKLHLYLFVCGRETFIDGNEMKFNIANHLNHLNTFTFNIYSFIDFNSEINLLPSNEHIRRSFENFQFNQISSFVDYFPKSELGQCHIYSHPYTLEHFDTITNNFSGGIFQFVRKILLFDERPFEHEFFLQISQSFPVLQKLSVVNRTRQNNKLLRRSKAVSRNLLIIEFPHLTELDLAAAHLDYVKQFLFDTKTCLPNDVRFLVYSRLLRKATRNFTRNTTKQNCSKVNLILFYKI